MKNELLENLERLMTDDVISWCKEKIRRTEEKSITRKGKNWYIKTDGCTITVNAYSCTVITAHREKTETQATSGSSH